MIDRTTARLTSRYLSYGLPFLYLLTSISFYLHTYDSAQVKITIVQMLGTVLMGLWYLKLACKGDLLEQIKGPLAAPLLASLFSGLLSFAHAAYRGPSLDECLRRVFYIHFALIALHEINTLKRLKRMIFFLLLATAVSAGYGLMQVLDAKWLEGLDPFIWHGAFGPRIFSTFGNPNFFGNFLVIVMPITLALLLKRNREHPVSALLFALSAVLISIAIWKSDLLLGAVHLESWGTTLFLAILTGYALWAAIRFSFLGLLFFLITFCNTITGSKGAWVGYTAGFVAFLILVLFYFSQFHSEKLRRFVKNAVFTAFVVCAVGVVVYSRARIDSIRFRVCTWVSTWEMAHPHPVLGNGIGSFRVLYPAYRRPQIFHIEGKHNTETDHAENEYWEVFQDEGLLGFGVFIWVIVSFSLLGVRALRQFVQGRTIASSESGNRSASDDPRAFYMLGVLAAFWGMLVHNLMDVSLRFVSSGIFLWLLAGLIGAMAVHDPLPETESIDMEPPGEGDSPTTEPSPHPMGILMVGRFITVVLYGFLAFNILRQFHDAQGVLPYPAGEQLLWLIAWLALLATILTVLWGVLKISLSLKHLYGLVILWLLLPPLHIFWGYFMADVYHNRGIFYSKQQNWDNALDSYRQVIRLNPNYIMAYYFMGNVYTDRWGPGDVDRAMIEYHRAWALAPNYVQSHHQAGLVFLKKGTDHRRTFDEWRTKGRLAEASQALQEAQAAWQQALFYFQKYHDIDPVFDANYSRMAWVHIQLAEIARLQGQGSAAEDHLNRAQDAYCESLEGRICCDPHNDVLREHWKRVPCLAEVSQDKVKGSGQPHRHLSVEMFENLGHLFLMRKRFDEGLTAYHNALALDPNNIRLLKNTAVALGQGGNPLQAEKTWQHIKELAPQDPDAQRVFNAHGNPIPTPHP